MDCLSKEPMRLTPGFRSLNRLPRSNENRQLAVETGCDAIHPGYGFLSENPELARLCAEKGVTFIGPSCRVIRRMGDKTQARLAMTEAGVPLPGSPGNLDNIEQALAEASRIGYPVMVKATSGGGGRGIRRCDNEEELRKQFPRVISEATKAFGSQKCSWRNASSIRNTLKSRYWLTVMEM